MIVIVRNYGDRWTVEVDGRVVGQENSEDSVQALIATLAPKQQWVPSWRFC
jgi:hypothetical protein